ncbi:MAG: hypothetical protein IJO93_04905 [Clostridia bacterium]|nr:hypothetical protein [Clostridia bacterium]
MSKFKPIPKKIHKPIRHSRVITATPTGYKPKLRKLSNTREATPIPHRQTFFRRKHVPVPKAPPAYKHKSDNTLSGKFIVLLLVLAGLIAAFVLLLMYLM